MHNRFMTWIICLSWEDFKQVFSSSWYWSGIVLNKWPTCADQSWQLSRKVGFDVSKSTFLPFFISFWQGVYVYHMFNSCMIKNHEKISSKKKKNLSKKLTVFTNFWSTKPVFIKKHYVLQMVPKPFLVPTADWWNTHL